MAEQTAMGSLTVANIWAGIITATLGATALFWLIPEYVAGATDVSRGLTPGFMPRVAAWCMIIFGVLVASSALRVALGKRVAVAEESEENETLCFGRIEIKNSAVIAVLAAIYVFALSLLGFLVPSIILLAFLIYLTGYRNKIAVPVIAIAVPLILELLLWHILQVPLPQFPLINF
jgi:hypothetical protein